MDTTVELPRPELSPKTGEIKEIVRLPQLEGKQLEITTSQEQMADYFGQFASEYAHLPPAEARGYFKQTVKVRFGSAKSAFHDNSLSGKIGNKMMESEIESALAWSIPTGEDNIELSVDAQGIAECLPILNFKGYGIDSANYTSLSEEQKIEVFKQMLNVAVTHEMAHRVQRKQGKNKEIENSLTGKDLLARIGIATSVAATTVGAYYLASALPSTTPDLILTCLKVVSYGTIPTYVLCLVGGGMKKVMEKNMGKPEDEAYASMNFNVKKGLTPFNFRLLDSKK